MPTLKAKTEWLRATFSGSVVKVDRDAKILRGYVLAQRGKFKTPGRGEFETADLRKIVELTNEKRGGLKSRFGHPTLSDDGIGKFLGRVKNAWMDKDWAARGDLHLDDSSFATPSGNLGKYVLDLAEKDPDALSSSLVLAVDEEYRMDAKGKTLLDKEGHPLPPIWHPKQLHASDVVDTGDAVDGILSIDGLPDAEVRLGMDLLKRTFGDKPREVAEKSLAAWMKRALGFMYGDWVIESYREELARMEKIMAARSKGAA